ncbi:MAG: AbiV family abortive infection protein [Nitrospirales bacterium]|nr:AbiV family abortive infection protein [Nitrospirales bacterium]
MLKNRLSQAARACVENGQRLHEDAEWLGVERSTTAVALCILAQEDFAKAFLLHLICEGVIPWTGKVRESLYKHKYKQLVGIIMEWLSPSDDAFIARLGVGPDARTLPAHVADAMKLYVEKVLPRGHISCPPAASDPIAMTVADGDRDKTKQDALYVRLSPDGEVLRIPSPVTAELVEAELERTKRFSELVGPLREGVLGPVFDYDLLVETMNFLLLDKRNRPFLLLKDSKFDGP